MSENTRDLSKFGYRELSQAKDILLAWLDGKGLPEDFEDNEVTIEFNPDSGNVFLVNGDYQVAMVDDDGNLYSFYSTPYAGLEGSFKDLADQYDDMHQDDKEYMHDLAQYYPDTKLPELKEK